MLCFDLSVAFAGCVLGHGLSYNDNCDVDGVLFFLHLILGPTCKGFFLWILVKDLVNNTSATTRTIIFRCQPLVSGRVFSPDN